MDRAARLLSTSSRNSRIIEVGAGYCPLAPKTDGWNTHVVDHATQAELRAKYAQAGVDLAAIEEVDTIWREGMLHDAVPAALHGGFDTLVASHVIEHVPNFVGFLTSAQHLLGRHGSVALAIPDRRYCFDYFKPPTMTGDILEAHAAGRSRHPLRTAWNHLAYSVTLDGRLARQQSPIRHFEFIDPFATAAAMQAEFREDPAGPYIDYHVWQFTPASFALVMLELGQLELIDWQIASLHGPEGFEFFALLRRGAEHITDPAVLQARRMGLLQQQLLETQAQVGTALLGGGIPGELASTVQNSIETDKLSRQLEQISAQLEDQAERLQRIERAALMVCAVLRPVQSIWRKLRRVAPPATDVAPKQ